MAGFLSLPSKELAQERMRNCKPLLIAASGFITGLIYPIVAFRHRNKNILISWLSIAAVVVLLRQFEIIDYDYLTPFGQNPVAAISDQTLNFLFNTKYGPACLHFISIFLITWISKKEAVLDVLRPLLNEKDAFPLSVRKTTSILKNIFDIDNEKAKDIYELAKHEVKGGVPSIEDLNEALIIENLDPVQFSKKEGLKIIPEKLRANLEKTPSNNKKISTKKTKATANKESSSFSESIQSIFTYGVGGLIGVFVIRVAKQILSN